MTAPAPLPPEQNIGPYYQFVGAVLLLVFVALVGGLVWPLLHHETSPSDFNVKVLAGLALVDLVGFFFVTQRPSRFDAVFRMVIAAIPWTKYQGPAGGTS